MKAEYKKQGVGRKLIENTINLAKKLNYKAIDAVVFSDNATMLRLLIALGFIPVGMEHSRKSIQYIGLTAPLIRKKSLILV
ncbi:GNAT family N-acetyltransferase [Thermodesulfobacteriota bacterium]